jgi:hypothetical protein
LSYDLEFSTEWKRLTDVRIGSLLRILGSLPNNAKEGDKTRQEDSKPGCLGFSTLKPELDY